jgi:hypothetical protein
LPEEGIKHNVGGKGMRGGLLCEDKKGDNVLEFSLHITMLVEK